VAAGAGGGGAGLGGSGGTTGGGMDHCVYGFSPDPRDAELDGTPAEWVASNGDIDLVMPPQVLEWLGERVWEESHDAWHNVRRCGGGGIGGSAICTQHPELVAAHKECADAEDGYQFLVMHRHMMQSLRQAFPNGAALFEGFESYPFEAADVPEQWRSRWGMGWTPEIIQFAQKMEDIENHLGDYATEGDLGKAIQCGGGANGAASIHGALHFKWVVDASPHSLGKQTVNIDNYMFWKLHGWIDNIWERYRVAKGLTPDEPKLLDALQDQCREMHALGLTFDPSIGDDPTAPLPEEFGYFHEEVRPILEKHKCVTCHSEASPDANMSLGGHISSAEVVENLVNVNTLHGGQFKRVVPGQPNQSWLYLKVAGQAASAGCTGDMCNAQVMPPGGMVTLTTAELDVIKKWITDGAPAPTQ
jgi:hypothetical protein